MPEVSEAGEVEALLVRGVLRLADDQPGRDEADEADGDVDVEDPVPADVLGDQAADERADRERHRRDAGPDPERGAALPAAGTWP